MVNLTKRSFLFGMIATPAIVSINNIMPVKLITDVTAAIPGDGFVLVSRGQGDFFWMSQDMLNLYKHKDDFAVIRSTTLPFSELTGTARTVDQMSKLTSVAKHQVVFGTLPSFMQAPTLRDLAYEKAKSFHPRGRLTTCSSATVSKFDPESWQPNRSVKFTPPEEIDW